jgi:hypothetical protein
METYNDLKVEWVDIEGIKPYENNAKEHPAEQISQIKKSIQEFGFNDPLAIWKNKCVCGHGRLLAAKELGLTKLPIIRLDHLTDEQRRAYTLVHNQLTMNSGFNLDTLKVELDNIGDIDLSEMGFDLTLHDEYTEPSNQNDGRDFFNRETVDGATRQEGNEEYNSFVEKYEPKKTTDDCYTPPAVYDAVADYVADRYGYDKEKFVRPFFPGGDYKSFNYPDGCVVVDNQPFSITAEILDYYNERNIKFFLFCMIKTSLNYLNRCCVVVTNSAITYENGAIIPTGFLTNLEADVAAMTAPELTKALKEAQADDKATLPKYEYPPEVLTFTDMVSIVDGDIDFSIPRNEIHFVRALDAQKAQDKTIYGGGALLSKRMAKAKKQAIEQATKETIRWFFSEKEQGIIDQLGKGGVNDGKDGQTKKADRQDRV